MDQNDPIWKLLDKAPLREPDAWFAARTVARLRRESRPMGWRRFLPLSVWLGSTAAVVVCSLYFAGVTMHSPKAVDTAGTGSIQEALNYIADRGAETDQWLAISSSTL